MQPGADGARHHVRGLPGQRSRERCLDHARGPGVGIARRALLRDGHRREHGTGHGSRCGTRFRRRCGQRDRGHDSAQRTHGKLQLDRARGPVHGRFSRERGEQAAQRHAGSRGTRLTVDHIQSVECARHAQRQQLRGARRERHAWCCAAGVHGERSAHVGTRRYRGYGSLRA
jgi:hypothetical protein